VLGIRLLLKTHVATALSVTALIDFYISSHDSVYASNYILRLLIYYIVWALQTLIDGIGHNWNIIDGHRHPYRNRWHSLPSILGIGLSLGIPMGYYSGNYLVAAIPVVALLLHWLEDLVTESGVYVWKKRVRLPFRIRYNSRIVNRLTILVFYAPLPFEFNFKGSVFDFIIFVLVTFYSIFAFLVL
jgi:hypothetical protein